MTKRRAHGDGGIDQRGENSFRLRYRVGGKRYSKSFRGTLTEARAEMRRLISSVDTGAHVAPDKAHVAQFIDRWLTTWAVGNVSAKTLETYQFHAKPIGRHLGTTPLQKLTPALSSNSTQSCSRRALRQERSGMCTVFCMARSSTR